MADETTSTPTATPAAPPDEGFLHSLATSLGIDPEAVKTAAKAFYEHPVQAAQQVGSEAASEAADIVEHPIESAKTVGKGIVSAVTNPEAQATAAAHMKQPGLSQKIAGAEEYLTSGIPLVGGNLVKAEEQAGQENIAGSMGTVAGTVAPMLLEEAKAVNPEGVIRAAGERARENQAARQEARIAEAKTGKIITVRPDNRTLPAPDPDLFAEADGKLVEKPSPTVETTPKTADPVEDLIMSDKIGGKKVRGATPRATAEPDPEAFAEAGGKLVAKAPEVSAPAAEYHPDLQKLADHFGVSNDASKLTDGASFITPDGKFVHLAGATTHDSAIDWATGSQQIVGDNRPDFLKNTGAVRTRFMPNAKAGPTMHISVPEQGATPEQIPAIQQAIAKAGRNGNVVMERADVTPETRDALTMTKEFPRAGDTEDYLRQIQAHPDQQDLVSKARIEEPPHKSTYVLEVSDSNSTNRVEKIDAFSNNEAMKLARKKFPDADIIRRPELDTTHVASTKYEVPTGKRLKMPPSYNHPEDDTESHEIAHALEAVRGGLQTKGILTQHHPIVPSDARAVHLLSGAGLRDPATGQIRADKRTAVLSSGLAGVASDELRGVHRAANPNFMLGHDGDGDHAYKILTAAGFSHEDALAEMHRLVDENIERQKHPAYESVVNENLGRREKGLSRQYHHSPERLQNMHAEIERRTANGEATGHDNGPSDEAIAAGREGDVPAGEGEVSRTGEGEPQEEGIVSEEKTAPIEKKKGMLSELADALSDPDSNYQIAKTRPERVAEIRSRMDANSRAGKNIYTGLTQDEANIIGFDAQNHMEKIRTAISQGGGDFAGGPLADGRWNIQDPETGQYITVSANITPATVKQALASVKSGQQMQKPDGSWVTIPDNLLSEEKIKKAPKEEAVPEVAPNMKLQASAQNYAAAHDMPEINHEPVEADPKRAAEIAKIYDEAKHDPNDPRVRAAYDALKSETLAQFHHLRDDLGLKFKPQAEDPYNSAEDMMDDIRKNNRLKVFTGSSTGPDHPLSEVAPKTGGQTYNTIFHWVHDAMGHAAGGNDFSENGEKSATEAHAQMYSDTARPAMRAETEGQTSWFFHNPEVEAGRAQPGKFAEQKATILPDVSHNWHEVAGEMAATAEAGGINPRTGKSDTKGFGTEILPELRQPLNHAPTATDFQKFYAKNQAIFDQYPELRVGFDNALAVKGGHEINIGAVGPNAAHVAARLDQKSAFDIEKGEIIPTGGTGLQTEFKGYPLEQRIKDLNAPPELRPSTGGTSEAPAALPMPKASEGLPLVSSRMPSKTVKGETIEEHTNGALTSDMQAAAAAPGFLQKLADRVQATPGFKDPGGDAETRTNAYIRHVADNVKFVWSKLNPEDIKKDEQWYPVGAHDRGIAVAKQHKIDAHQAYAVTAALSPLTDWDVNTSLAERAVSIWKNQQDTKFTPEMRAAATDILSIPAMKKFKNVYKGLEGKTLGELKTTAEQAHWLRLYDEAHNPREYQTWNPDGTTSGLAKNQDGSPKSVSWSFQSLIENAIDTLKDGSQENISKTLGTGHKIRNFYNNQLAPDDPRFLTIDTHAVNVGQLRPMSGKTVEVRDNFGGISNKSYGLKGTYALHDAGYRLAANELGVTIPSRLQSPTWVKIREVFPNRFKTPENQAAVDAIWKDHTDGKITADQARDKIWAYAEGWNARTAEKGGNPPDQGKLFEPGVSGEASSGTAGRGNRSDVAPANSAVTVERRPGGFDVTHKNGRLQIDQSSPTRATIKAVDVDEGAQRQGIATQLYEQAKQELLDRGITTLTGSLEGSGPVQLREKVFGFGHTKYFHGSEEISAAQAIKIMDKDFGYVRAETTLKPEAEGDTSFEFGANAPPAPKRVNKVSLTQQAKNDAMVKGLLGLMKPGKK